MRLSRRRIRTALLLATALVAVGAGLLVEATDVLRRLERDTVDARFDVRGARERPGDVAVVAIDEQTFADLNEQWPFPRRLHARAIDRLREAGARAIAYDVEFTEPSDSERDDLALFDATQRAGNVVLMTVETDARGRTLIFGGDDLLREARARAGHGQLEVDRGGVVRRFRPAYSRLDTLPVAAVERATGRQIDPGGFDDDGAWVDYAGPRETVRTFSFSDLVRGRVPPDRLRGKIVVVGASATLLQDTHPTSVSGTELMPGAEIHANAIDSLLRDFPLRDAPGWLTLLAILVAGLAAPVSGLRLTGLRPFLVAAGLFVLYLVAVQLAFDGGRILPVTSPAVAFVIAAVGTLGVYFLTELRRRRRLRANFARFVPAGMVEEVVERAEEEDLRLGGVRREGTVMFCDLRDFTAWAESQPAERVIEVLNRYLTEMSDAILDHGGTVVSYMGDGIMAVFGAPVAQEDHADRALAAARHMLDRCLPSFNRWLAEQGLGDSFRMGIGINSGPVMSGNVGSERRLEYAAVGDTTNTASRIEAATKGTDHQLLVGEATRERLNDAGGLVCAGEFTLRGRQTRCELWTLDGGGRSPAPSS